jgi:transcriptional regulator with XRE-family HTH domain
MNEQRAGNRVGRGSAPGFVSGDGAGQDGAVGSVRLGSYLRKLREGYGYTLRKVEEQAVAMGEAIDNSQLSRFEKGKAVPSFDKLRALGRVFNVPVQNFSDVLDLEEYQHLKPEGSDYAELLRSGADLMVAGQHGHAYVTFERALEIAETTGDEGAQRIEHVTEARWRMACALKRLGKLYMTEQELREILKSRDQLKPNTRLRCLLQLSYLYRELGDLYLASVLARECLDIAGTHDEPAVAAGVLNTLGNIEHDERHFERAMERYREALAIVETIEGHGEFYATVLVNLGGCQVELGRIEEGLATLRDAHGRALRAGTRKLAALALTRMAEAHLAAADNDTARARLSESDALATRTEGAYHDILFLNSYHRWQMARRDGNRTGEKIAFGRLRHLRSSLQRRFPELDAFDRYVEGTRR